ncbi:MAG: ABC transporter ATP-binding protein [Clostridia bacterium]|nr:ABC transporter ATP-binding protein [Clostridia bacterium]
MSGILISNLGVKYDDKVIFDGFNLELKDAKISVILGGSGVGKTTLLNAIAGLKTYSGSIETENARISYIFQKDRLIPTISVYKNLDLILRSQIADKKIRHEKIENMLELLEISDVKDKLPTEISGGQAQRVAMARAYLYESKILLLDEPFKALDTALKARLLKALVELNEKSPRTIVFVTHAIDECLLVADEYFVLGKGENNVVEVVAKGEVSSDKKERSLKDEALAEVREKLLTALL